MFSQKGEEECGATRRGPLAVSERTGGRETLKGMRVSVLVSRVQEDAGTRPLGEGRARQRHTVLVTRVTGRVVSTGGTSSRDAEAGGC